MAINATATTMLAQNALRKEHLNSLRDEMASEIVAQQKLAQIAEIFTHEKGPFSPVGDQHMQETSWQLGTIYILRKQKLAFFDHFDYFLPHLININIFE